ncbi:hypothetical protein FG2_2623 [Lactococcus cremoris]|nr:hypothetical protein AB995_0256 [Lactococcus cremoris]KZK42613.1 hypothetical protein FG2_2623 [Lactococcus cremoris]KZK44021.1 hypothetical protein LMG6897_0018 [Lactococcus cremoris]
MVVKSYFVIFILSSFSFLSVIFILTESNFNTYGFIFLLT